MDQPGIIPMVQGMDTLRWNPATDPHIACHYSAEAPSGKALCKLALQTKVGLSLRQDLLLGVTAMRVLEDADLLCRLVESLKDYSVQWLLLDSAPMVENRKISEWTRQMPGRVAFCIGSGEAMQQQFYAGVDAVLIHRVVETPSVPPLLSMRYGAVPVVPSIGIEAAAVVDVSWQADCQKTATGFVFDASSVDAMIDAIKRVVAAFRDYALWQALMRQGMCMAHL